MIAAAPLWKCWCSAALCERTDLMFQTRIFHVEKEAQEEVDQRSPSLNAIAVCFLHLSDEDGGDGAQHITLGEISRAKLKKNNFARLSACK